MKKVDTTTNHAGRSVATDCHYYEAIEEMVENIRQFDLFHPEVIDLDKMVTSPEGSLLVFTLSGRTVDLENQVNVIAKNRREIAMMRDGAMRAEYV